MPITPLDLQTNLFQLSNVGMEQGALKSSEIAAMDFQGKKLVKESIAHKEKVIKLQEDSNYLSVLNKDEKEEKEKNYQPNDGENLKHEKNQPITDKVKEIDDPLVGNIIDIET